MLRGATNIGQRIIALAFETHLPRSRIGLQAAHTAGDERRELGLSKLEGKRTRIDARELEQIVDETRERLRLLV